MRKLMSIFVMVMLFVPENVSSQQIDTAFWGNKSVMCDLSHKKEMIFGDQNEYYKFLIVTGNIPNKTTELNLYVKNNGEVFVTEGDKDFFCITFVGKNMKLFRQQKNLDNKDFF